MFQWWSRRYLNCHAVHSSVSCVYDTSCFFVSCNAHRFPCGVLTQEVKYLLTQIYGGVSSAKCAQDEVVSKQMSQQLQLHVNLNIPPPVTIQMSLAIHYLSGSGFSSASFLHLQSSLSSYLSHAAMCLSLRKWRFLHIFIHLIRSQSKARAWRWITCGLDIVPQNFLHSRLCRNETSRLEVGFLAMPAHRLVPILSLY